MNSLRASALRCQSCLRLALIYGKMTFWGTYQKRIKVNPMTHLVTQVASHHHITYTITNCPDAYVAARASKEGLVVDTAPMHAYRPFGASKGIIVSLTRSTTSRDHRQN
eukprot:6197022-Pleurochrysis_carterae.AAC.1